MGGEGVGQKGTRVSVRGRRSSRREGCWCVGRPHFRGERAASVWFCAGFMDVDAVVRSAFGSMPSLGSLEVMGTVSVDICQVDSSVHSKCLACARERGEYE